MPLLASIPWLLLMSTLDTDAGEAYADDTLLTRILGGHPKTKILIALIGEARRDCNPTDIARLAGIDRTTFYKHIDELVEFELVEKTRVVGQSQMYQINRDSPAAEALAQLEWELIEFRAENEQ